MAKEEEEEKASAKKEGDAEEEKEGEGGLEPPKKKFGGKKMVLIGAAAVLLLVGGGAGLFFSGVFGGDKPATEEQGDKHEEAEAEQGGEHADPHAGNSGDEHGAGAPTFFPLGDILVNLAGDGKRPNFLKIKVSIELASGKDLPAIEALKPRIVDNFQVYLRELRVEDLRGSAGLYRLREELLLRVTEAAQPIRVKDILFQEMLVQ